MKQRLLFYFSFFAIAFLLNIEFVHGVIAYPNPVDYKLPNGTSITIRLMGDEKVNWAETLDGYSILLNEKGFYEYTILNDDDNMVRSGVLVSSEGKRTVEEQEFLKKVRKGLRFSQSQISIMLQIWDINEKEAAKAFPTTGERKLICILMGFADLAFTKTQAEFNNLFNQIGYSAGGATGSVKDYYLENSYGQFNLTVDVAGPYTASQNFAFYGGSSGTDNPRPLIVEAINAADPDVNYADYDNDGDGWVDGVYVIYAGYGREAGGPAGSIWAHAWQLVTPLLKDGVYLSRYSCSSELRGNSGSNITRIGVICHEFGHVLGAPDYYDTDYETGGSYSGTGQWDMMAGGSWNNNGATPAHHNGFTKVVVYNWASATVLNSPSTITLNNAAQHSNSFYRINTTTTNEYFFLENREKHLFDAAIPGSGMIIYHVHSGVFSVGNSINATHPQRMYPVAQNATMDPTSTPSSYGSINDATCAWTGTGKTSFTDATLPSSKSWAGNNTAKPITNILRNAGNKTVTFDFMGGAQGNPTDFEATPVSQTQINLSWQLNDDSNPVVIAWTANGEFGTPVNGTAYSAGSSIPGGGTVLYSGSATTFEHTGLTANTTYHYKVWSVLAGTSYSPGLTTDATTLCGIITNLPFTENFNASTTLPNCWSIVDNQGNGQVWQIGTHSSGLTGTTGNYAYLNSDAYGNGNSQNADLITPLLDLSGYSNVNLSFKHYYKAWSGSSGKLFYSIDGGSTWTQIQQWTTDTSNPATFNQAVPQVNGQSQVKFKWNYTGAWGYYWDIDDVEITGTSLVQYTLTINKIGDGSVNVNGSAYTNPVLVSGGSSVNLSALADAGWQFEGWSGDLTSTSPTATVTMDSDKAITATFTEIPQFTLTISVVGNGVVEVNDEGYTTPITVFEGTTLNLEALTDAGWQFEGWSGDLTSTSPTATVTMDSDKVITATFTEIPQFTLTISVVGNGEVEVNGSPYANPITVFVGTTFNLTAIPNDNWAFDGWSGSLVSTNVNETVTMTEDKDIIATFTDLSSTGMGLLSEIQVFPNPFQNSISIRNASGVSRITITNMIGQTLMIVNLNETEQETIHTDELTVGIYLISIQGKNGEKVVRRMVKH